MNRLIHNTPNYIYEAAACIEEQYSDNLASVINNHQKFGMTRDEIEEKFSNFKKYKAALIKEIYPIYNNYKILESYFKTSDISSDTNASIALSLVVFFGDKISTELSHEEIDQIMNKYMASTIEDFLMGRDETIIEVTNLEGVLILLNKVGIEDSKKMQLINLYYNRYDVIEKLQELLKLCAPICEKYFYIIKEDFDKAQRFLHEKDNLEDLLSSSYELKISIPQSADIYSTIFTFNSLSLFETRGEAFTFYIGIYFFDIFELKSKNRFNDTQLITDLKAIGDPTRLKMIHLLSNRMMYVQELAEALELTPATVSHHINILLKSELISITFDTEKSRKIYYETNEKKFESLGDIIKSLVNYQ